MTFKKHNSCIKEDILRETKMYIEQVKGEKSHQIKIYMTQLSSAEKEMCNTKYFIRIRERTQTNNLSSHIEDLFLKRERKNKPHTIRTEIIR